MSIPPISFTKPEVHEKGWGREKWVANNDLYCGKILEFNRGACFSMHFHDKKVESWYVVEGKLLMRYYDLSNADQKERVVIKGDVVHVPRGNPHQLIAMEDSVVYEVSTNHDEADSFRVGKGSSQLNKKPASAQK